MVKQQSEVFTTIAGLNKQYEIIRDDILIRHGYSKGSKVRLKNAIMLYQNFNGQWLKMTSVKSDMIERIKIKTY